MIIDADVDEFSTGATALAGPITGDAVADFVETAELFDINVENLARLLTLVAALRLERLQVAYSVQSQPPQDAADSGRQCP